MPRLSRSIREALEEHSWSIGAELFTERQNYHARDFVFSDRSACLAIFDGNCPPYFALEERVLFDDFLAAPPCPYVVLVDDLGVIVGCGGFDTNAGEGNASLCWGMVARELHGQGVGQILLELRLERIAQYGISEVLIETSQHTARFFQKSGFNTVAVTPDGFGPGVDCYRMMRVLEKP
jgi:GNAT superfamily N-acetyltransferase